MYTYDLIYMALFARIVDEEDTLLFFFYYYYYRLWFWRVKIAVSQEKKTTIFCTVTLSNVW